jgi:hypothetical protein
MSNKRYIGFYFEHYYPRGGVNDLLLCSNCLAEVEAALLVKELDDRYDDDEPWCRSSAHIYDCEAGEIVKQFD